MSSKVQICNLALTRIAASRITALTDATVEAKDCSAIYDLIAEEVMSLGAWPSCRRRAALAQLATAPAFEFSYAYSLPTNPKLLKLISINETKAGQTPYIIEGSQLLTDEATINIYYIALITDVNAYDIYLQQAVVDRLTAELIYSKTGQLSAYKAALSYAMDHAKDLLAQAGTASSSSSDINSDTFIDARNSIFPNESRLRDS